MMLAKERWQADTIRVLEMVFEERCAQMRKHGTAMAELPDGTGPDVCWIPILDAGSVTAGEIEETFRWDYQRHRGTENLDATYGQLTRMHLVREELAEAFERAGDDPELIPELLQVAALCVQWVEIKLAE